MNLFTGFLETWQDGVAFPLTAAGKQDQESFFLSALGLIRVKAGKCLEGQKQLGAHILPGAPSSFNQ